MKFTTSATAHGIARRACLAALLAALVVGGRTGELPEPTHS